MTNDLVLAAPAPGAASLLSPRLRRLAGRALGLAVMALPVLAVLHGLAHAQAAGGAATPVNGGLGKQAGTTASDLSYGFGTLLEFGCYGLAGIAATYAAYTFWQHNKNPNGQHRISYAFASILAAGFLAGLPSMVGKSAETVTNGQASVTGQAQQLTYSNNGNG